MYIRKETLTNILFQSSGQLLVTLTKHQRMFIILKIPRDISFLVITEKPCLSNLMYVF